MPYLDRDGFIALLNRLGDDDDAAVLAAARELDRRVRDAGADWDGLLAPPPGMGAAAADDDTDDTDAEDGDSESGDTEDGDGSAAAPLPVEDTGPDADRIRHLLDTFDLLDDTREDLEDMLEMITDGEFSDMDRRYVQALEQRLGRKAGGKP